MADVKRVYTFGNKEAEGNGKMRELLGGKGANLAEMNLDRHPRSSGIHHHHRSMCGILCPRQGGGHQDAPSRSRAGDEEHRETDRHEVRRQGDAAAGFGPFGRTRLDARHDGHDPQPGYERPGRGGCRQAHGQPPLRMGLVPPFRTDVRRRGAGHEARIEGGPRSVRGHHRGARRRSAASRTTPT